MANILRKKWSCGDEPVTLESLLDGEEGILHLAVLL